MDSRIYEFDKDSLYDIAYENFLKACKIDVTRKRHQKINDDAHIYLEKIKDRIKPRGIICKVDKEFYHDNRIEIDNKIIDCKAFQMIPEESVRNIYIFIASAGEVYSSDDESLSDAIYSDLWGNAYVDAVEMKLQSYITESVGKGNLISPCFGPGYYGMSVTEAINIYNILHGEALKIQVRDTGVLIPQKSCSGIFFEYSGEKINIPAECADCKGNKMNCQFCRLRYTKDRLAGEEK